MEIAMFISRRRALLFLLTEGFSQDAPCWPAASKSNAAPGKERAPTSCAKLEKTWRGRAPGGNFEHVCYILRGRCPGARGRDPSYVACREGTLRRRVEQVMAEGLGRSGGRQREGASRWVDLRSSLFCSRLQRWHWLNFQCGEHIFQLILKCIL